MKTQRKKQIYHGLSLKLQCRIAEKPGETFRQLASYLEAKPKSTYVQLSKMTSRGVLFEHEGRYFATTMAMLNYRDVVFDSFVESAEQLEKTATSHNLKSGKSFRWVAPAALVAWVFGLAMGYLWPLLR